MKMASEKIEDRRSSVVSRRSSGCTMVRMPTGVGLGNLAIRSRYDRREMGKIAVVEAQWCSRGSPR